MCSKDYANQWAKWWQEAEQSPHCDLPFDPDVPAVTADQIKAVSTHFGLPPRLPMAFLLAVSHCYLTSASLHWLSYIAYSSSTGGQHPNGSF
jgi:hypothetical protein